MKLFTGKLNKVGIRLSALQLLETSHYQTFSSLFTDGSDHSVIRLFVQYSGHHLVTVLEAECSLLLLTGIQMIYQSDTGRWPGLLTIAQKLVLRFSDSKTI